LVGQCPGLRTILGQNLNTGVSVLAGVGIEVYAETRSRPGSVHKYAVSANQIQKGPTLGNPSHEEIVYQHFPNPVSIVAPADKPLLI